MACTPKLISNIIPIARQGWITHGKPAGTGQMFVFLVVARSMVILGFGRIALLIIPMLSGPRGYRRVAGLINRSSRVHLVSRGSGFVQHHVALWR